MNTNDSAAPGGAGGKPPTLAGLWDAGSRAIVLGAQRFDSLAEHDRARSVAVLTGRVRTVAAGLDDGALVAVAFVMVDDLYKSCFTEFSWSAGVIDYLGATAGTLLAELDRRGFVLHYVVDNVQPEADLRANLAAVPVVFQAAGLAVTGPQLMALQLMQQLDRRPADVAALPAYRAEGHHLADRLIERCHRERRSSVYLSLDVGDSPAPSLAVALAPANTPGTVVVFRDQAPTAGSVAHLVLPPGVALPVELAT